MLNLLEQFYEPDSGSITVGGVDIRDMDLEAYRQSLALVQQNPKLFSADVRTNIAYGVEHASQVEAKTTKKKKKERKRMDE